MLSVKPHFTIYIIPLKYCKQNRFFFLSFALGIWGKDCVGCVMEKFLWQFYGVSTFSYGAFAVCFGQNLRFLWKISMILASFSYGLLLKKTRNGLLFSRLKLKFSYFMSGDPPTPLLCILSKKICIAGWFLRKNIFIKLRKVHNDQTTIDLFIKDSNLNQVHNNLEFSNFQSFL